MTYISADLQAQLSRYKFKELLGKGGMASVYRAEDMNLHREVAIKVMHDHLLDDPTFKDRFQQEARFVASFNHPNIIQVYDFDVIETDTSKLYFMVMPYLPGKTMSHILDECRNRHETLTPNRILEIVGYIASALDYAHGRGMVHRDVKPANIIFDDDDRAILTDFGIARLADFSQFTQEGMIVGTPIYMSPEQAIGGNIDHRSDIYSLGTILFELLTGRTPFISDGSISILLQRAQYDPPEVSEFMAMSNPLLDMVLHNVLARNPDDRYQSGKALMNDLRSAIEHGTGQQENLHIITDVYKEETPERKNNATRLLSDTHPDTQNTISERLTQTLDELVIKPAKRNPMAFTALSVSVIVLLLVTRLIVQNPFAPIATPIPQDDNTVSSMTSEVFYFESDFSRDDPTLNMWEQNSSTTENQFVDDGNYIIVNEQSRVAMTALFDETYTYDNVTITLEGTLQSSTSDPNGAYGIVFRHNDAQHYNVFAVDGRGRFSIWVLDGANNWIELRGEQQNWLEHESINSIGESNTLTLEIYDTQVTGYVNGVEVISLTEDTYASGNVGVYVGTATSPAEIAIDRYIVEPFDPADNSNESMTGDDYTESMTDTSAESEQD